MIEFIFISSNDIHVSDTTPRGRVDDYKEAIFEKIEQMRSACTKLKADAALIAGDLFYNKEPVKNSHNLVQRLIDVFKTFPCPIYAIEGNHDLTGNNIESLERQPLGVLFKDGTLKQLREEVLEKDGAKISLVGVPYNENLELKDLKVPDRQEFASQICLLHQYAGIKGGMLYTERLYGYEELSVLSPDIFVIGHYHVDQGVYQHNGKWFVNIGSMSRGTISEEDIDHHPQIGFIKIHINDDGNPTYAVRGLRLKVKPASEVFDLTKKAEEKKESKEIKEFVERLASEAVAKSAATAGTIDEVIEKMDMAKVVKDRAIGFIHKASTK